MAFKTLASRSKALLLDKKGDKVQGHLIAAETKIGQYKSTIYTLDNKGELIRLWGNQTIDSALLDEKGRELRMDLRGVMARVTVMDVRVAFKGTGKNKVKKTYRDFKVEADEADKIKLTASRKGGKVPS